MRVLSLFLLFFVFVAGCGGPAYRTRVIDTPETRELKGHQKPYEVNGIRYDPMLDHRGYVEEGLASWYGKDFHGRKTSNGEIYDMYAMTAAHKTLPLGVYVRVENRQNGAKAVVRVNDRGPFVKGRIIDLSYTAASQLGVVGPGTAPVRVEALGLRETDAQGRVSYRPLPTYEIDGYAIQVGAFTLVDNANRLAERLKARYGSADVQEGVVNGTRFFRVRVGNYKTLAAAESARNDLQGQDFPGCFIVAFE